MLDLRREERPIILGRSNSVRKEALENQYSTSRIGHYNHILN